MRIVELGFGLFLLGIMTFAMGCAAGAGSMRSLTPLDGAGLERLRDKQMSYVLDFDRAISPTSGPQAIDPCDKLCTLHTKICKLSTHICALTKLQPSHPQRGLCKSSLATCRETNRRIPENCWCRD